LRGGVNPHERVVPLERQRLLVGARDRRPRVTRADERQPAPCGTDNLDELGHRGRAVHAADEGRLRPRPVPPALRAHKAHESHASHSRPAVRATAAQPPQASRRSRARTAPSASCTGDQIVLACGTGARRAALRRAARPVSLCARGCGTPHPTETTEPAEAERGGSRARARVVNVRAGRGPSPSFAEPPAGRATPARAAVTLRHSPRSLRDGKRWEDRHLEFYELLDNRPGRTERQ
jgi:hypothetical protein